MTEKEKWFDLLTMAVLIVMSVIAIVGIFILVITFPFDLGSIELPWKINWYWLIYLPAIITGFAIYSRYKEKREREKQSVAEAINCVVKERIAHEKKIMVRTLGEPGRGECRYYGPQDYHI